ncbi:major capsid protein [Microvirga sp. G4-2]|uniref:major capsid protein n=1 Tax=Microvirga sp. G4-2 TaxID=3434467 RepID=UPI004044DDA5
MALIGTQVLTLADLKARFGADGKVESTIIETLNQANEVLDDMMFKEANGGIVHKTVIRTGLPSVAWRMLNYGVPKSKSQTAPVQDTVGMLEAYAEVDKSLADMSGNVAAFRDSEAQPFLESMSQAAATTLWYGNTDVNPERYLGLAPRFSKISTDATQSGSNIVDAGGTGATNTSLWLVVWGDQSVHGIYPKGSKAGLSRNDKGQVTLQDASGNNYEGYRDHFKWDLGLTVRDWRYAVRIANIDVGLARTDMTYLKGLLNYIIDAEERVYRIPGTATEAGMPRAAWYGNRTVRALLRRAQQEKIANNITTETIYGKPVTAINGIPLRLADTLLNTEARVV